MAKTKIIFWGTPEFAIPTLAKLAADPTYEIAAVITQPDKPSGRKQELTPSPVKIFAQQHNLPTWQPTKLKEQKLVEQLKKINPEVMILVAYGKIIPPEILNLAPRGIVNIHPSLLPKFRGPSPLASALLNGESTTGVSLILLDEQMDHGPIIAQQATPINELENQEELSKRLAELGSELLIKSLPQYLAGQITPIPQNDSWASFCRIIDKTDGKINWQKSAKEISNQIRALFPWPGTFTDWPAEKTKLKIFPPVKIINDNKKRMTGEVFLTANHELAVACGENAIAINYLQLAGKNKVGAKEFLAGYNKIIGQNLN